MYPAGYPAGQYLVGVSQVSRKGIVGLLQLNPNLRYGVKTCPMGAEGIPREETILHDRWRDEGWKGGERVMMEADVRAWLFPRAGMGAQFLPTPRDHCWLPTARSLIATDGLKGGQEKRHQTMPERQDILDKTLIQLAPLANPNQH